MPVTNAVHIAYSVSVDGLSAEASVMSATFTVGRTVIVAQLKRTNW